MKDDMAGQGNLQREDFERALRARYAQAATHLSARTQAQLHNRLHAAIAQGSRAGTRRSAWWLATACALALVVVFGVQWRAGHEATLSAPSAPALVANGNNDGGELVATLDETPDLYLWLASDDANALATE